MTAVQICGSGISKGGGSSGPCKVNGVVVDRFPAGMRILVVDDDTTCLKILEQMLRRCDYDVTVCSRAIRALFLLRERKDSFDLVISDVHMPDMDGFRLLELIGLEMDLPVIMMSADTRTSTVMKGIKHGACNYLVKPVRLEELKNIWQHVVRRKWSENKDSEQAGGLEDPNRLKRETDDAGHTSSVNDRTDGNWKPQKKRRDAKEHEDDGLENDDSSTSKKARVVWSVELHQQFVSAVDQLGFDKAVPKRILELMNVSCLTRENVASHLQKYRLYLKRLGTMAQPQGILPSSFCGLVQTTTKALPFGRLHFQSLAASGQISPEALGSLHTDLLGQQSSVVLPAMEQPILLHPSLQGPKCVPVESGVTLSQRPRNCQSSSSKQFPLSDMTAEGISSGFGIWTPSHLNIVVNSTSFCELNNPQDSNMLVQNLQQRQHQLPLPNPSEASHAMDTQASSMVGLCLHSTDFHVGKSPASMRENSLLVPTVANSCMPVNASVPIKQDSVYGTAASTVDCMFMSSQQGLMGAGQLVDGNHKYVTMPIASGPGSISYTESPCLIPSDGGISWRAASPALGPNPASVLSGFMSSFIGTQSSSTKMTNHPNQGPVKNHGFVGGGSCIPSRFAVDVEFPSDDLNQILPAS
ncbi:hypothetical protein Taro_052621 [Colocasia esculenta]|uniref:Two-component response regulator n=1 Tax=Colocasia esculenta TaxID=4460 RepID=A0A843XJ32_COLES|nr:hypothetical protein [Colocasia esculenta]